MRRFDRIYCIIKQSELHHHHATADKAARFPHLDPLIRDQIQDSHENQQRFIRRLKDLTSEYGLEIVWVNEEDMGKISPQVNDLVLSCGGDGTFLSCAQKYQDTTLLGLNSDYKPKAGPGSYGALTSINRTNLQQRFERLVKGDFFIDLWNRLQVKVNGKLINRYAVNDIYFGNRLAYQACNITVIQSGIEHEFNCSGILCCTGMGSHAWYYNAGGSPFSNELNAFGFSLLFPNLKRTMKFTSGVMSSRNELVLIPHDSCVLSYDSQRDVVETEIGDEIRISLAPNKAVRVVSFDKKLES